MDIATMVLLTALGINPNQIALQTVDVGSLPMTIGLLVVAVIIIAVAFIAIYWGYSTVSDAVDARKVASAQALVAAAKADMTSDFEAVMGLIRTAREQEFLLKVETGNMGVLAPRPQDTTPAK